MIANNVCERLERRPFQGSPAGEVNERLFPSWSFDRLRAGGGGKGRGKREGDDRKTPQSSDYPEWLSPTVVPAGTAAQGL